MTAAARALGIRTAAASFAAGARGERLVGHKLKNISGAVDSGGRRS